MFTEAAFYEHLKRVDAAITLETKIDPHFSRFIILTSKRNMNTFTFLLLILIITYIVDFLASFLYTYWTNYFSMNFNYIFTETFK